MAVNAAFREILNGKGGAHGIERVIGVWRDGVEGDQHGVAFELRDDTAKTRNQRARFGEILVEHCRQFFWRKFFGNR